MKKFIFCLLSIFYFGIAISQSALPKDSYDELQQIENNIKGYSDQMINADHWFVRFQNDSLFTRGFVKALRVHNSFYYPFDSIKTVSKLYAPDSSFRIYTWQMMKDFTYYRQRGAIQMRTADGSLKLFPLFDASSFTKAPNDSIRDANNWIGAIYYKILMTMDGNKKVYTLLGLDENGPRSNKKWMDILTFDEDGIPHFGGDYFKFEANPKDTVKHTKSVLRFSVEYKKESRLRFTYDRETDMIIFDHLVSESDEPEHPYTCIPDGSYEAFKWTNNRWEHISKLSTTVLGDGNAPMDNAILDEDGNVNQAKLDEMMRKNKILQAEESKDENPRKFSKKKAPQPKQEVNEY